MKLNLLVILFCSMIAITGKAQDRSLFLKKEFIYKEDTMPYRILLPLNYNSSKNYPLILFLHGSGERGNDNEKQLVHGSNLFLRDSIRQNYTAFVVFPQCSEFGYWSNVFRVENETGRKRFTYRADGEPTPDMALLQELLKSILKTYPIDKKQVYVGGLSMGGMGTFEIVRRNPKIFAAAFPICGGAEPSTASAMKKVHWWIFHGGKDDVVIPAFSEEIVEALKKKKADVKFTLYPEANHNSWDNAFAEPGLLPWLFSQHKK
ncbi:MAG: dienelactone hydrolase family protein [Bacteroidota bacterium]